MSDPAIRDPATSGSATSEPPPRPTGKPLPAEPERLGRSTVFLYLATIVLIWGGNWALSKIALRDAPPLTFTAVRILGAAIPIGLVLAARRVPLLPERGERWAIGWTGMLQIGLLLSANMLGLQFIPPGRAAILTYTMPIWAIPLGFWLLRDRPGRLRLAGGAIGLLGLVVFFDPRLVDWHSGAQLVGNGCALLGAMSWALGAVLYRRRRWRTGFWTQIFWQIAVSLAPVALLAVLFEQGRSIHWTAAILLILAFNWLLGTALAYWCWARVLATLPAATAGQVVMLAPVFAYVLSALFFGESVTPRALLSIALIFLGLTLTLRGSRT